MTREEREAEKQKLALAEILAPRADFDPETRPFLEPVTFRWDASSHEVLVIAKPQVADSPELADRIVERLSREDFYRIRDECLA